ncbi:MAG: YCF48-related protein [Pseudomonadota bacterium]
MMSKYLLCAALLTLSAGVSAAAPAGHAEIMPKATSSTLLDIAVLSKGFVMVGARGHVLTSKDGQLWSQKPVPTRAMLNRVIALADGRLFAVGYDGVILLSSDQGEHWKLQHQAISDQRPNTLYDAAFVTPLRGYAIGAFGLMLVTEDGGKSWLPVENPLTMSGLHLNAIANLGEGGLIVSGERGLLAVSRDGGLTWKLSAPAYAGSYFGILPTSANSALVFGQRGRIYAIDDVNRLQAGDPASFDPLITPSPDDAQALKLGFRRVIPPMETSFFGGSLLSDGRAALVGADAAVVLVDPTRTTATAVKHVGSATYSRVIRQGKKLLVVGMHGISSVTLPEIAP